MKPNRVIEVDLLAVFVLITKGRKANKVENHRHIYGRSNPRNGSNNQGEGVERKEKVAK